MGGHNTLCLRTQAEKFTRWNEPKSGINPFVPPRRRSPGNFVGKALKVLVGSAIALLRLPILLVLFVLLAIAGLLAKLVRRRHGATPHVGLRSHAFWYAPTTRGYMLQMPIRALSRLVKFLLESPLCYLCLMFLGFYNLQATTIDRRRVHLPCVTSRCHRGVRQLLMTCVDTPSCVQGGQEERSWCPPWVG